jgi:hypothetical protein
MAWQDYRLITPSSGALISEWQFAEGSGTAVDDAVGANNINLDLPTTPNYTWSARGITLASGLVQTPSITSARTVALLYKVGIGEATGFELSGGSGSGAGLLADSISTAYTVHVGVARGVKPLEFRDSNGTAAYQLNRGGWILAFCDFNAAYTTALGFGGRHSTTSSRCTAFEVAWAAAFSGVLTTGERQQIYEMARVLSASRSFYLDWRDAPVTGDVVAIWGQSNGEGRAKLTDLSAEDAARTTPNTYICRRTETSYALMVKGTNQQTDAPTTDFGPELGMAWEYEDSVPTRDLYFAKYAIGSTYLTPTAGQDWATSELEASGHFWFALRNLWTLEALMLNAGVGPKLRGVFWMQGEQDATADSASLLYMKELRALVDKYREQVADPQAMFCIGRIRDQDPAFDATAVVQVRLAQVMTGGLDNGTVWIDTDSFALKTDNVHYNAAGMKALGQAVYDELLQDQVDVADLPSVGQVLSGVDRGDGQLGTYVTVAIANVRSGTTFGVASALTGTLSVPAAGSVLSGVAVDATTGTYVTVSINDVESGVTFGAASALTGVFGKPTAAQVLNGVGFGANSTEFTGTVVLPAVGDVQAGVTYGASSGSTGTFDYPDVTEVLSGVGYGAGGTEFIGTLVSWTTTEMEQIRHRLGLDGASSAPAATPSLASAALITSDLFAELASPPAANSSLKDKITWLFMLARNKILQTSSLQTVKADDGATNVATAAVSDDGVTAERSEFV